MSRPGRSIALLRFVLLTCAALLPRPAAAQEEGLFELRLTAIPESRTVSVLLDPRGQPLVPLRAVLDYLQIPIEDHGDTVALTWPPGAWSTRVDLSSRVVSSGRAAFTVPAAEWVRREREVFLSPAALGRVLAAEVSVDWENVSILLGGRTDFPAVRRTQDAARREGDLRAGGGALRVAPEPDVAYPARNGGWTAGWGISGDWTDGQFRGRGRGALGAALLGGSVEGGGTAAFDSGGVRLLDPYGTYDRAFPRSSIVRRVQLGDVLSDGLITRPFFGVAVTNEPVYMPRFFGQALIRPVVPAGWEYEVYQGEYLVGVSTRGTQEPVPTPIGYGTTPVRVRLLGPAGQERIEELTFLVPAIQVPPGEWRYFAGAGACRTRECQAFGYADLRRGVSRTLTVGAGVDHTARRDSAGETHPYGIVAWNPAPEVRTEIRARAGSFVHVELQRYGKYGGWRAAGGWKRQEGFSTLTAPEWFTELGGTIKVGLPGRGQLLGLALRTRGQNPGGMDAWQVSATSGYRRLQLTGAYETGFQATSVATVQAHFFVPRDRLRMFPDLNLTSRVDWSPDDGLQTATLGAVFRPRDRANVTVTAGWNGQAHQPELAIGLITRTRSAYVQSNAYSQGARHGAFLSAGGGVAFGSGGVVASPFETMGRGGVAGRVFYDENGNGVMDPGEQPAADVPVTVGGERARSGESGEYRAWGLLPYAVLPLGVDTLSLTVTDVAPRDAEYLLRPTPNAYTRVDLPLVRTREAAGHVRWRGRQGALGGISVEIRRDGDAQPRRAVTFSDGEFYVTRLPAGDYTLTVAASSLAALGATTDPASVRFTVPATPGAATVQIPPIYLRK